MPGGGGGVGGTQGAPPRLATGGMDGAIRIWQQHSTMEAPPPGGGGRARVRRRWARVSNGQPAFKISLAHAGVCRCRP
eukprot:6952960-Pyramimonas_sp.AAC.1